jgi:hypothetical protein
MMKKSLVVTAFLAVFSLQNLFAFYDPGTQRWLNRDPLGEKGGLNLYTSLGNSPLHLFDSWGLSLEDDIKKLEKDVEDARQKWQDVNKRLRDCKYPDEAIDLRKQEQKLLDDFGMKQVQLRDKKSLLPKVPRKGPRGRGGGAGAAGAAIDTAIGMWGEKLLEQAREEKFGPPPQIYGPLRFPNPPSNDPVPSRYSCHQTK